MAVDKLRFSTASGSRTDIHVYCHFYCHKKLAVEVAVEFEIGSRKIIVATDFDQHGKDIWTYFYDSLKHLNLGLDKHIVSLSIQIMVRGTI